MDYYKRALELNDELVVTRRHIHANAEVGLDLPMTTAFVTEKLRLFGLEPQTCGKGIVALVGQGEKCILLRADMDALPMKEESGLPFACPTGYSAHCCGHDLHTTMLLGAARMLKENEHNLAGTVKLMFQPGEETGGGACDMIDNGVMNDPKVDVALAYHVSPEKMAPGGISLNYIGTTQMAAAYAFQINITGKGCHAASPQNGVDPITVGVHIHLALQELIARESDPKEICVLTIGQFSGGSAHNVIPDTAMMQGSLRTKNEKLRQYMIRRITEVSEKVGEVYRAKVEVQSIIDIPSLRSDPDFTKDIARYMLQIPGAYVQNADRSTNGSEDFANITALVPSAFVSLSAGFPDDSSIVSYPPHHAKVQYNENVLSFGAASFAQCATEWLKEHA